MKNNRYKQYSIDNNSFDIKDFFSQVKKKWIFILAAALLFGILFSAVGFNRQIKKTNAVNQNVSVELSQDEVYQVERIKNYQNQIKKLETYINDSLYMKIDPFQESVINLQYHVKGGGDANTDFIFACRQYVELSGVSMDVAADFSAGCDQKYIGELIQININTDEGGEIGSDSFSIVVMGRDETEAKELAALVNSAVMNYAKKQADNFPGVILTLIDQVYSENVDTYLNDSQNSLRDAITNYQLKIQELSSVLTAEQIAELNTIPKDDSESEKMGVVDSGQKKPVKKIDWKYTLIGLIVGGVGAMFLLLGIYLFKSVISTENELHQIYGLRVLGRIKEKINTEQDAVWSKEQIAAEINACCISRKISEIYIMNLLVKDMKNHIADDICILLKEKGIRLTFGKPLSENPSEMVELARHSEAVLLVRFGETKYDRLMDGMVICEDHDITALGCIVLK